MVDFMTKVAPEIAYTLCGLVSFNTAIRALKNEKAKIGTALFWAILSIIFIFGNAIPYEVTGGLLLVMGFLTVTRQVKMGKFEEVSHDEKVKESERIGNAIFVPAVAVGVVAVLLAFIKVNKVPLNGAVMVGIACVIALLLAMFIARPSLHETRANTSRQLMQVGAACLLPQLLGALGTLFTKAGVGDVISSMISGVVPSGNIVIGVIIYCLGMVIFTMIMGNAFAAFSVITLGIGIPFVIAQGGNPVVVGALGMTCGFCGTLLTPMAANFNIVPTAVLETKGKWTVIKAQAPMALIMIVVHIILMLLLAF